MQDLISSANTMSETFNNNYKEINHAQQQKKLTMDDIAKQEAFL